jgi:succinate dehydrogenase / fumarate reductase, cytochrome b subunit
MAFLAKGNRFATTSARELLIAVSGLALVGFILGHLAGNLLFLLGPEAFNAYAEHLQSLGPLLWVARIGLLVALGLHMVVTILIYFSNRAARGSKYVVKVHAGRKYWPTRIMIFSGAFLFIMLLVHLKDFTFTSVAHASTAADIPAKDVYAMVFSTFTNPLHAVSYILFVTAVGLHFSHAISSVWLSLGLLNEKTTAVAEKAAWALGALVAVGFSMLPLSVLIRTHFLGGLS